MAAAPGPRREHPSRPIRNRQIVGPVLAGIARHWLGEPGPVRSDFLTNLWIELKRYGAPSVRNVKLSRLRGIDRVRVDGPIQRHSPLVVTALSMLLECETVFHLGPDPSDTVWLLAHNLPNLQLFVLEERTDSLEQTQPKPSDRVYPLSTRDRTRGLEPTSGASRIAYLSGDSTTFDFLRYSGMADLVYIEGSRRHTHVRSDTEAAFGLLSELGTIVWDGYLGDPSLYAYLNELAPSLDRPILHILGTRLALYSRWDILLPEAL